ncbi:MAG: helix-turn-helix domain-containing protein [Gemmatimonadota bacterium]|nr:helix-turn-helix domain-containing protein [Gemmatimonadota bacterium]
MKKFIEFLYIDNEPVNVHALLDYLAAKGAEHEPHGELRVQALVYCAIAGEHQRTGAAVTTEWISDTLRFSRSRTSGTCAALLAKGLIDRERILAKPSWRFLYWPVASVSLRAQARPPWKPQEP